MHRGLYLHKNLNQQAVRPPSGTLSRHYHQLLGLDLVEALPLWVSCSITYPRAGSCSKPPFWLSISILLGIMKSLSDSLISRWWYRTPPWVKEAQQWIIDKLQAIKSISLKGSGHVTDGKGFCRIKTEKSREELEFILDRWQKQHRRDV